MLTLVLEAAFRSALMAALVWSGTRIFRVHNVLAQKVAWALVLLCAVAMPIVMHSPFLAMTKAIHIPMKPIASAKVKNRIKEAVRLNEPLDARIVNGLALMSGVRLGDIELQGTRVSTSKPVAQPSAALVPTQSEKSVRTLEERGASSRLFPLSTLSPLSDLKQSDSRPFSASSVRGSSVSIIRPVFRVWSILYGLYFVLAGAFALRTIFALCLAARIWHRSAPISIDQLGPALEPLNTLTPLHVRVSPELSSPATIGSTILLPADYENWDEVKLRVVVAHELSHVRQRDFYLQLAAAIHASIFWFSPLGWWLKRKLSDLGEALSDHAGLEQADSPYCYAQILLEFAARPHQPSAGVAMARSSNLSSRIDRIINSQAARLAFIGGRSHIFVAGALAPLALLGVVCCIRIVPQVQAAQSKSTFKVESSSQDNTRAVNSSNTSSSNTTNTTSRTGQIGNGDSDQAVLYDSVRVTDPIMQQVRPAPPTPVAEPPAAPEAPGTVELQAPEPPTPPEHEDGSGVSYSMDDSGQHSFAIVGDKSSSIMINGRHSKEFEVARAKYHHNFIWFERDGKSYVITDPAIVAQSSAMFQTDPAMKLRQEELQRMQSKLDQEMKNLQPQIDKASQPGPEFQAQMAKLNAELAQLQSEKFKHLDEQIAKAMKESGKVDQEKIQEITQEKLGELSEKMGEIQGQIGEIQGKIGERQGLLGEKQGEFGERMGRIGEQMGKIGEEQGRRAEEASRKMHSVIDQAVKDGKAKPVD